MTTIEQQKQARHYYMAGKTQKEIAQLVGVSDRTVYSWIHQHTWHKLRLASLQAPLTIADNLCSQVVELQNTIASRDSGQRFATPIEADTMRKLINSLDKMKKYPSLSTNMQVLETFRNFVRPLNMTFTSDLSHFIELFVEGKSQLGYAPYQVEYGVEPTPPVSPYYEEPKESAPARVMCKNNVCSDTRNCHYPYCHRPESKEPHTYLTPFQHCKLALDYYTDTQTPTETTGSNLATPTSETTEKDIIALAKSNSETSTPDLHAEGEPPTEELGSTTGSNLATPTSEPVEKNEIAPAIPNNEISTPDLHAEGEPPSGELGVIAQPGEPRS